MEATSPSLVNFIESLYRAAASQAMRPADVAEPQSAFAAFSTSLGASTFSGSPTTAPTAPSPPLNFWDIDLNRFRVLNREAQLALAHQTITFLDRQLTEVRNLNSILLSALVAATTNMASMPQIQQQQLNAVRLAEAQEQAAPPPPSVPPPVAVVASDSQDNPPVLVKETTVESEKNKETTETSTQSALPNVTSDEDDEENLDAKTVDSLMSTQSNGEEVAICQGCDETFASYDLLKEHIASQHLVDERKFECETCGLKFTRASGRRRHYKMVHLNFVHKCPFEGCEHPGYKCPKALAAHIRTNHTHLRPYVCQECQKSFVRANDLRVHRQTHDTSSSGATLFECSHCGAHFRRNVWLARHELTCHMKTEPVNRENVESKEGEDNEMKIVEEDDKAKIEYDESKVKIEDEGDEEATSEKEEEELDEAEQLSEVSAMAEEREDEEGEPSMAVNAVAN